MLNIFNRWRAKKKRKARLIKIFLILLILLTTEVGYYYFDLHHFNVRLLTRPIKQALSFPYYLKAGFDSDYTMLIGDLNGLNKEGYKKVLELTGKNYNKNKSFILVPGLTPDKSVIAPVKLTQGDFIEQAANSNRVVLVDNFCTNNWGKLNEKPIYKNSGLSPGPFCASERETQEMNRLLGTFAVKKVIIVYDIPEFQDFISNFTDYLKASNINYEFIQSREDLADKL